MLVRETCPASTYGDAMSQCPEMTAMMDTARRKST